jgi:hypothetical protein
MTALEILPVARRLFGKIKAVRQIIAALTQALAPVMNAFALMLIVVCICESRPRTGPRALPHSGSHPAAGAADAIVGVTLYSDRDPGDFARFDRGFVAFFKVGSL